MQGQLSAGGLRISFSVRGHDVRPSPEPQQQPGALITFYDDRRATIGEVNVGVDLLAVNWQREERTVAVPLKARDAILRIGLLGGTGELSLDDVRLTAMP